MNLYQCCGKIKENDLCSIIDNHQVSGYAYSIYSDRVELSEYDKLNDVQHLLEIRIFNNKSEFKAIRSYLGEDFIYRLIDDSIKKENDCRIFDEDQYLDINSKKSEGFNYETTGGGKFTLPIENAEKIRIRNYIVYDGEGIGHFEDFRVVEIIRKDM